jgi:cob(I)alamin adenosyltransferase
VKIYTRTGDKGETALFAGGRVSKGHVRLHAYGTVDELNSILGIAATSTDQGDVFDAIRRVQAELFSVGADLATPLESRPKWLVRVSADMVEGLERDIDGWEAKLPPLTSFILPGGGMTGAYLHLARTVCRRAERWLAELSTEEAVNPVAQQYVNRLSDWLFVLARYANNNEGRSETEWRAPQRD